MTKRIGDHHDHLQSGEIRNAIAHLVAGNPGSPVEGQWWYNTSTRTFNFRSNTANIVLGRLDQISAPTADVSLGSQKITSLAAGVAGTDAVNLNQLQDAIAGLAWKDSVRVATTANGTLTTAFANGQAVDGVTLATGDRILLKNQTTASQNGIYVVAASGAPTRATDADTATDIRGATVFVEEGTANAGALYTLSTDPPITIDTTALTFVQFGGATSYTAGGGIGLTGSQFFVTAGTGLTQDTDGISLTSPVTIALGGTNATDAAGAKTNLGFMTRYTTTIGGAATVTVTHNLNNLAVIVQVYDTATGAMEDVGVTATGVNAVDISFSYTPSAASKRVVVIG